MIPAVINLARKSKPVEEPEEAVNLRGRGRVADVAVTNGGQQACLHKGVSSFWIIWRMPKGQLYIRWLSFPIDPLDRRIPSSVQLSFSRKERRRFFAKRRWDYRLWSRDRRERGGECISLVWSLQLVEDNPRWSWCEIIRLGEYHSNVFPQIYIFSFFSYSFSPPHLRFSIPLRFCSLNRSREFVASRTLSKKMVVSVHCRFSHRYRASIALPEQAWRRIGRSFPDSFSSFLLLGFRTRVLQTVSHNRCSFNFVSTGLWMVSGLTHINIIHICILICILWLISYTFYPNSLQQSQKISDSNLVFFTCVTIFSPPFLSLRFHSARQISLHNFPIIGQICETISGGFLPCPTPPPSPPLAPKKQQFFTSVFSQFGAT